MRSVFFYIFFSGMFLSYGQIKPTKQNGSPKLVVGLVVDQMRYDYLTRFYDRFGTGGFKRLMKEGYSCANHHYNFIPTKTAPGHASIYTGTTPSEHGVISNLWYDHTTNKKIYCVDDPTVKPVGTGGPAGRKSPKQLQVSTIPDQLKLHTQQNGKTVSIAIKDRAAILSGGHTADAAYWFRGKGQGIWISSSFYMDTLPDWVKFYNSTKKVDRFIKDWYPLYNIDSYLESGADTTNFERGFRGKSTPKFPYDIHHLMDENNGYDILRQTPFGNSLTLDFAKEAIVQEGLGDDWITDFLAISFSSTDYIGHNFGVNSKEVEDTYLRLDQDLESLLLFLDTKVGRGEYTLFLTSDHGAGDVSAYLKTKKIPAGYFKEASFKMTLRNFAKEKYYTDEIILKITNNQVWLNNSAIEEAGYSQKNVQKEIAHFILNQKGIDKVFTRFQMEQSLFRIGVAGMLQRGFHLQRSGDVVFMTDPLSVAYSKQGSAHGSGSSYDTHVPLIFFGKHINKGKTTKRTNVTDIAPTIAALLGIAAPNHADGKVHEAVLKE